MKKIKIPEGFFKPTKTDKERVQSKKLSKALVDMDNIRFSTARKIQAVNEVLAIVTEEANPRTFRRAMKALSTLTQLK